MILKDLIEQAKVQAKIDHFSSITMKVLFRHWHSFQRCCYDQGIFEFSEDLALKFCEHRYGSTEVTRNIDGHKRAGINAIRKLIEFSQMSEFKTSYIRRGKCFSGKLGEIFEEYLTQLDSKNYKPRTLQKARSELYEFYQFLMETKTSIDKITRQTPEKFISSIKEASQNKKYFLLCRVRSFLRWLYDSGNSKVNFSAVDYKIKKPPRKIPEYYQPERVKELLDSIDRSSPKGKRDYLLLLMIAVYGLRASEISTLKCSDIDWEQNTINVYQVKTNNNIKLPLISSVGNAIIDYYRFCRPQDIETEELFISLWSTTYGKPLSVGSINHLFCETLKRRFNDEWWFKKHGPHVLRYSLASNLLDDNIPIHTIKQILGHKSEVTTMGYIRISLTQLEKCCLVPPDCLAPLYGDDNV